MSRAEDFVPHRTNTPPLRHSNPLLRRRQFLQLSLAALSGTVVGPGLGLLGAAESAPRPNSKVSGVQLGINVPYSFGNDRMNEEEILKNCVLLGLSAVELRTQ